MEVQVKKVTPEATLLYYNFTNPMWVASEEREEHIKGGMIFDSLPLFLTWELNHENAHTRSRFLLEHSGGVVDAAVMEQWIQEEKEEPEHKELYS